MLKTCQPGMNSSHELRGRSFVEWGEFNVSLVDARVETDTQSNERGTGLCCWTSLPPPPLKRFHNDGADPKGDPTSRRRRRGRKKNATRRHEMRAT